jgi:hypothetical protein
MLAAGWGATGSVGMGLHAVRESTPIRASRVRYSQLADTSEADHLQIVVAPTEKSLRDLALEAFQHLTGGGGVAGLSAHCASLRLHPDVRRALDQAADIAGGEGPALLLLAHWVNSTVWGAGFFIGPDTLKTLVDKLDRDAVSACLELFERLLGPGPRNGGRPSRSDRLRKYLDTL